HLSLGRATHEQIAALYGCSARTIRRRLVEYGFSPSGPPVYTEHQQPDGTLQHQELDALMLDIYERFSSFGRRMIDGYLLHIGERVPHQRIVDSYNRVIGPTTLTFAPRRIHRRVYSVPGPNSLWHHDGQD
ncbi:hypothetical protein C0992_012957, partial [Termitomyces sp. T32_za158]